MICDHYVSRELSVFFLLF